MTLRLDTPESDERAMLRAGVRALVTRHGDWTASDDVWRLLQSQIGGAAVAIPEEFGGGGGTAGDIVVILEELGAGLVASPMLGTVLAAAALAAAHTDATGPLLSRIAAAGCTAAVAFGTGTVVDAVGADIVLGVEDDRLVHYDTSALRIVPVETMDPSRSLATVDCSSSTRTDLGPAGVTRSLALTFAAAEQIGAARRCLELTVDYTGTRVQFGRPVGSFQALKHRMPDLYVGVEAARALVHDAAASFAGRSCDVDAVAAASLRTSESLSAVAAEAVQMHGGIGVTWEHPISWYFKRAHGSRYLFGTPQDRMTLVTAAASRS